MALEKEIILRLKFDDLASPQVKQAMAAFRAEVSSVAKTTEQIVTPGVTKGFDDLNKGFTGNRESARLAGMAFGALPGPLGTLARALSGTNWVFGATSVAVAGAVGAISKLVSVFQDFSAERQKPIDDFIKSVDEDFVSLTKSAKEATDALALFKSGLSKEGFSAEQKSKEIETLKLGLEIQKESLRVAKERYDWEVSAGAGWIAAQLREGEIIKSKEAAIKATEHAIRTAESSIGVIEKEANAKEELIRAEKELNNAMSMGPTREMFEKESQKEELKLINDRIEASKRWAEEQKKLREEQFKYAESFGPTREMFDEERNKQAVEDRRNLLEKSEEVYQESSKKLLRQNREYQDELTKQQQKSAQIRERNIREEAAYEMMVKRELVSGMMALQRDGISGLLDYVTSRLQIKAFEALAEGLWFTAQGIGQLATPGLQWLAPESFAAAAKFYGFAALYGAGSAATSALSDAASGSSGESTDSGLKREDGGIGNKWLEDKEQQRSIAIVINAGVLTGPRAGREIQKVLQDWNKVDPNKVQDGIY